MREFSEGWEQYLRFEIGDEVLGEAARLAREHVLRAYDAIHLGSAVVVRSRVRADVAVASWDDELAAARREGFSVLRRPRPRG